MGVPLRVLLVEDSEDDALLLVRELRRAGFDVTHERVETPAVFAQALRDSSWDLVLADYSMPHFSGTAALQQLNQTGVDVPFIFVSGSIGEDTAVQAMKSGAHDYVMKGNLNRLAPAIQRELREAETRRERRRAEKEVRELQKFEFIGKLAGGIAHDFNNVLGAIVGWAEIGRQEAEDFPEIAELFQRIHQEGERAAGLTRQLLAFARRQVLAPRNLDWNATIKESLALLRTLLRANIEMKTNLAPDLNVISADPSQMQQILLNLCLNARDAMPNGGVLRIATRNVTSPERTPDGVCPGNCVVLEVADTGEGMSRETLERVFEPFFTTKPIGKGTGLGLSTVQGIVKQHGGFIDISSEVGRGTAFRIYMPAHQGAVDTSKHPQPASVKVGHETILIAEDNEGMRKVAELMLSTGGYHVLVAEDGEQAVSVFKANRDQIALVVLDLMMPAMGGKEAHEAIDAIKPGIPVIYTTGYSEQALEGKLLSGDGSAILQKPYSGAKLVQTIRELLDRSKRCLQTDADKVALSCFETSPSE